MNRKRVYMTFAALTLLGAGCDDDDGDGFDAAPGGSDAAVDAPTDASSGDVARGDTAPALTYWQDVAPIFFSKCVKCHQGGGIGEKYHWDDPAQATMWASAIAKVTQADYMPPFHMTHDGTCGDFQDAETLTAAEKQTIKEWADGEKAIGTPATLQLPAKPVLAGGTDFKTPTFKPERGKIIPASLGQFDEYRCFLVEPNLVTDAKFITGYDVLPGTSEIVHHVLGFVIDPAAKSLKLKQNGVAYYTNGEVMAELDARDADRAGWPCFSGAGEGTDVDAAAVAWAPGQGVVSYPAGTGFRLKKTDKIVIQVHYNLADDKNLGKMDTTTVRMRLEDAVTNRLVSVFPDSLLESLEKVAMNGVPDIIPHGQASFKYVWKKNMTQLGLVGLPPVQIIGVMPHMHERGRKWELRFGTAESAGACVGEIKRWDFGWQRMYFYRTPPTLSPTSVVQLTCDYDTSKDTQPVLPGWGTRNEMCLAVMIVKLPPGI